MAEVHPTAVVAPGAELAEGVEVGALAWVGPRVRLGPGTVVHHHASIDGATELGTGNEVFPYAFVGGRTQDKKWDGDEAPIRIGDRNIFREFCTVHPATFATGETRIGSDNLFCAYSHIGHESHVGDGCVFSNNATLGGHVVVGDRVVIGGLTAVHQFCRIGDYAMLGGCGKVLQDVLPYMLTEGQPSTHRTVNKVGLQRGGFSEEQVQLAVRLYKFIFRSSHHHGEARKRLLEGELGTDPMIDAVTAAMQASQRGLA